MSEVPLGRYQLLSELGRGGMGIVYRAFDPMLERDLAIKVLPPKKLSEELLERFRREARAVAKLDSPNIVKIYDIGKQPDGDYEINYIVMEFVEGRNLGELFHGAPRDNDDLAARLDVFDQVLEAVHYAHSEGVIHRDLKPDNIMVTSSRRAKIMDFGLAFFAGSHSLTNANQVMGTVAYFSPEQASASKNIDHRADLYALGVVLFELMTGQLPFVAEHPLHMMRQVLNDPPRKPSRLGNLVTPSLEAACLRCLEKEPALRFGDVGELRQAIKLARLAAKAKQVQANQQPSGTTPPAKGLPPGLGKTGLGATGIQKTAIGKTGFLKTDFSKLSFPRPTVPPKPKQTPPPKSAPPDKDESGLDMSALLGTVVDPIASESAEPPRKPRTAPPEKIRSLHPALASSSWQHEMDQERKGDEPEEEAEVDAGPPRPKIIGPGIFCQCGAENQPDADVCFECGEEIKPSIHIVRQDADTHFKSGVQALSRGHLEEARREFSAAVQKNPEFGEAFLELGKTELSLGLFDEAHKHLEASMNFMSSHYEALMNLADLYQQVEQPHDVISCLQDVLEDFPRETHIRCRLALLYCQVGQVNKALATYRTALKYEPNNLAANRQLGLLFAAEAAEDEAIHYLEVVVRLDPNDGHVRGLLGKLYAARGQYRQAEDSFARAIELRPKDPDLRVEMSHLYYDQGRLDKAGQVLQRTLGKSAGHLAASRLLSQVRLEAGDTSGARSCLEEALAYHPEDDRLHRQLGEVYLLQGNLDGALDCFEKVVELRPDCAEMRNQLGRLYLKKNYDDKSIQEYSEAVNLNPLDASYREDLGMAYYVSGKLAEAAAELHKATRLDGRNADYFKALGFIYGEMSNADQAVDHFKYALHLDPSDSRTYAALARARMSQGLANAAIELYQQALVMEPALTVLHLHLARALAAAGRSQEAVKSFRDFAATVSDRNDRQLLSSVFVEMGQTLFEGGDPGQAAEVFQAALSHPESQAQARVGLARVSLSRSDFKAAASHLKRAMELEPRNPDVWHMQSMLCADQGKWGDAVSSMETALKLRDDDPELWIQLGRCYRKAGRNDEADRTFAKAAERFPEHAARFYWLRGRLAIRRKNWSSGYESLNRSLELSPGSWRVHEDMAQVCLGLQNWRQAEEHIRKAEALAPASKKSSVLQLLERLP